MSIFVSPRLVAGRDLPRPRRLAAVRGVWGPIWGTEPVETIQVDIGPGQLTIASVHLVGSEAGDTQRFARARRGVVYQVPKQQSQPSRRR